MKTLYLSDLDGTLLRQDKSVSQFTVQVINSLTDKGILFSYATARSFESSYSLTSQLNLINPVICCNGAIITDIVSKKILSSNFFMPTEVCDLEKILTKEGIFPIVNAFIDGKERFSYIGDQISDETRCFIAQRKGDKRAREVDTLDELYTGKVFRLTLLGSALKVKPINDLLCVDQRFTCIYQNELYLDAQSLEVLPINATKANAALALKSLCGCEKLVVFGDGTNDLPLFSVADEKYATENATAELKKAATAIIPANEKDGVALWLERNVLSII